MTVDKYPCRVCGKKGSWSNMRGNMGNLFCQECFKPNYKPKEITKSIRGIGKIKENW